MLRFLAIGSLCVCSAVAQDSNKSFESSLAGDISNDSGAQPHYSVVLTSVRDKSYVRQVLTDAAGRFHIGKIAPGDYELSVLDEEGHTVQERYLQLRGGLVSLGLRISDVRRHSDSTLRVNFANLQKIPRKAEKEFEIAHLEGLKGNLKEAILHLQRAVAYDPQFAAAHSDLGARYVDTGSYDAALAELDIAARLNPADVVVSINKAVCLTRMHQFNDAEVAARHATEQDASSSRAHLTLGVVLLLEHKSLSEAVEQLGLASSVFPVARITAAEALAAADRLPEARQEAQKYLNSCFASDCEGVRQWLAALNGGNSHPGEHHAEMLVAAQ